MAKMEHFSCKGDCPGSFMVQERFEKLQLLLYEALI